MKTSPEGVAMLSNSEGIRLKRYKDTVGKDTIGVGHLITGHENPAIGDTITKERAMELLASDLEAKENCVNDAVTVFLKQNEFDALVHFTFNVGCHAFVNSTLLKKVNAQDHLAGVEFLKWVKQPELKGRRLKEQKLYDTGVYS